MLAAVTWTMYASPIVTPKLSAPPLPLPTPSHVTRVVPPALGTILSTFEQDGMLAKRSLATVAVVWYGMLAR